MAIITGLFHNSVSAASIIRATKEEMQHAHGKEEFKTVLKSYKDVVREKRVYALLKDNIKMRNISPYYTQNKALRDGI
jgi:hypothetical protein